MFIWVVGIYITGLKYKHLSLEKIKLRILIQIDSKYIILEIFTYKHT